MKKENITIIIYTYNEENNIRECIKSARLLTNEIILVDMESCDKTLEIAKEENLIIYTFPHTYYVEPARKFGIEKAKTDWVFILDADERITEELAKEIKFVILTPNGVEGEESLANASSDIHQRSFANAQDDIAAYKFQTNPKSKIQRNTRTDSVEESDFGGGKTESVSGIASSQTPRNDVAAYKIPRNNIFGKKKWLQYGGWSPDFQIRLINKNYFLDWPKEIHSTPQFKGEMGYLKNNLLHYFHGNFEKMVEKTVIFEDIESNLLFKVNRPVSVLIFFRKFFGELYRRLIKKQGFRDGTIGIMECIYQAFSKTITYLFLYEKKTGRSL